MPDRIATAQIVAVDPETLEVDDQYPGAYGFTVRLSTDPGPEWVAEFDAAYAALPHAVTPPVRVEGDCLKVFFIPLYEAELPAFLAHLEQVVAEANRSVEARNAALPDDGARREAFRSRLRTAAAAYAPR